jgi:hypothetical protein
VIAEPAARAWWSLLPDDVRAHLEHFFDGAAPRADVALGGVLLPPLFARDLAGGGPRLREAFPQLARTVTAVEHGDPLVVRVACEGVHAGTFFGLALPSGRRARFTEVHELAIADGRVVADRVTIDLRALVRQLVAVPARELRAAS